MALLKQVFTIEKLPEPPPPPAEPRRRVAKAARWIFSIDPLPLDEPDAPPKTPERGLLASLFAPEKLPLDPPGPPRRANPYLRWLLGIERLDEKQDAAERSSKH